MREGAKRGYRRARQEMENVAAEPEDLRFHAWRRRVKDHWYQMRLIEGLNGRAHARVRQLNQLQTWLGDDHNLVVLRDAILGRPPGSATSERSRSSSAASRNIRRRFAGAPSNTGAGSSRTRLLSSVSKWTGGSGGR